MKVKFLGVWDTVGALGVPFSILPGINKRKYGFHDQTLSSIIKNAYHALAIDERREAFSPALWKAKDGRKKSEQVWFPGVHSDVGGGYAKSGLSFVALEWMVKKAKGCGLSINTTYLKNLKSSDETLHDSSETYYTPKRRKIGKTSLDESVHSSAKKRYHDKDKAYQPVELLKHWGKYDEIEKLKEKEANEVQETW